MDSKEFNRLLKAVNKSEKAIETLYDYFFKRIVFHLQIKFGRTVAEDAAQMFFESLLHTAKLDYIKYPTSWVYTCSENIAKRIIEKDTAAMVPENTNDASFFAKEEIYGDLYCEIKKLSPLDQDIIFKHYWEGYSLEEIAQMHECKAVTIRVHLFRATKKLNKFL